MIEQSPIRYKKGIGVGSNSSIRSVEAAQRLSDNAYDESITSNGAKYRRCRQDTVVYRL